MQILDTYYCTYDDGSAEWFIGETYRLPYLTCEYRKVIVPEDGAVLYNTDEQSYSLCVWIQQASDINKWVEIQQSGSGSLAFTSTAAATLSLSQVGSPSQPTIKYSYNNSDWQTYTIGTTLSIAAGGYVFFKNESYFLSQDESNYFQFVTTGNIQVSGDIASMINYQPLNFYCFYRLFASTSITTAPSLSYTTLSPYCYAQMFYGCTSLTSATLPATALVEGCYKEMFKNASSFNNLNVSFTAWLDSGAATTDWLSGAASAGQMTYPSELSITQRDDSHLPAGWNVIINYFYLQTTVSNIATLTLSGGSTIQLEYSLDRQTWQSVTFGNGIAFTDKLYLRGNNSQFNEGVDPTTQENIGVTINASNNYQVGGNIMSLKDTTAASTTVNSYDFYNLFKNSTTLTSASDLSLPATTLASYCYGYMFSGCSNLTAAPSLPATTLATYCYVNMFNGCSSLIAAPTLAATQMYDNCYSYMFSGCSQLINPPTLNSTQLAQNCYEWMFYNCENLTSCPALPATTLANKCYFCMFNGCKNITAGPTLAATQMYDYCYYGMFYGCENLATCPQLQSIQLANACYEYMFRGCQKITSAPALNATTLFNSCYYGMFYGCSLLVTAPTLNAETLVNGCYQEMFKGCSVLTSLTVAADDISATNCITSWLDDTASGTNGIIYSNGSATFTSGVNIPSNWTQYVDVNYFYLDNEYSGSNTVTLTQNGTVSAQLEYSFDKITWQSVSYGTGISFTDKIYLRGTNASFSTSSSNYISINATQNYKVGGNIMTLKDTTAASTTVNSYDFYSLFKNSTTIISATDLSLPATTMGNYCYAYMFRGCSNLATAPTLGATTLAEGCYSGMFYECTSLSTAPQLSATPAADHCYEYMFYGCSNLTTVGNLASSSAADYCYANMFEGCSSLVTAPTLGATQLAESCYLSMFSGCSSLATAPTLSATQLAAGCYEAMFYGCSSLATAPALSATQLEESCYSAMFEGCSSLTAAPTLSATQLAIGCYSRMFYGCTALVTAPQLLAVTLTSQCYQNMFNGCSALTQLTVAADDISATNCITGWLNNTASGTNGIIYSNGSATFTSGVNIPSNWTQYVDVNYFYLDNEYSGSNTVTLTQTGTVSAQLEYSLDKTTWLSVTYDFGIAFTDKIYFRGDNATFSTSSSNYIQIQGSRDYSVGGNIMSLKDSTLASTTVNSYDFYSLFFDETDIINATNLILPATTLANFCYAYMFGGCSNLATAPTLGATTLAAGCYYSMFNGCYKLTTAPQLPATTLFNKCYWYMFADCKLLTSAPTLPAQTIYQYSYAYMFEGCLALTSLTVYADDISTSGCISGWLNLTASGTTGTLHSLGSATFTVGTDVPSNWQVVTTA